MKISKETLKQIILEEIKTELDRDIDANDLGIARDGGGVVMAVGNRDGSVAIPAIVAKRKFGLLYKYADHKMKMEVKYKDKTTPEGTGDDTLYKLFKATRAYAKKAVILQGQIHFIKVKNSKKALILQNEIKKIRNSILNLVPAFKKEENRQ